MPSASRIEALSGSRRFAFSSATVACAARPFSRCARPCWKRSKVSLIAPLLSEAKAARFAHASRQTERSEREQAADGLAAAELLGQRLPQSAEVAPHRPGGLARSGLRREARGRCVEAERLRLDAELVLHERRQLAERRAGRHLEALVEQEVAQLLAARARHSPLGGREWGPGGGGAGGPRGGRVREPVAELVEAFGPREHCRHRAEVEARRRG